jgi:hypothetical protein
VRCICKPLISQWGEIVDKYIERGTKDEARWHSSSSIIQPENFCTRPQPGRPSLGATFRAATTPALAARCRRNEAAALQSSAACWLARTSPHTTCRRLHFLVGCPACHAHELHGQLDNATSFDNEASVTATVSAVSRANAQALDLLSLRHARDEERIHRRCAAADELGKSQASEEAQVVA